MSTNWDDGETTLDSPEAFEEAEAERSPALTILWHPEPSRVGQRVRLLGFGPRNGLSRAEPTFTSVDASSGGPLDDPYVSRRPIWLAPTRDGGIRVSVPEGGKLVIDGQRITDEALLTAAQLARGSVVHLANRVLLLLHELGPLGLPGAPLGLIGASEGIIAVRDEVRRVASLTVPVLIRGESGTGKELVARALHDASDRAKGPFVAVNMAALTPGTAASELFGHARGAFTGAVQAQRGLFERAHGGTLLLDEIGVASREVQSMLLRTLETSQVQPVGGGSPKAVDVRVVAATDARLDEMLDDDTFSAPLFHRLAGYTLSIPPLRERKDDLGRLLCAFVRESLTEVGGSDKLVLSDPRATPWLTSGLAERLALHPWPGNVRELRNAARQIVVASHDRARAVIPRSLEEGMARRARAMTAEASATPAEAAPPDQPATRRLKPSEIGDDQLIAALEAHGWSVRPTARALGISKTSLYALIDRSPQIRRASDVSDDELRVASDAHGKDVNAMASALRVSPAGLRLRLRELEA